MIWILFLIRNFTFWIHGVPRWHHCLRSAESSVTWLSSHIIILVTRALYKDIFSLIFGLFGIGVSFLLDSLSLKTRDNYIGRAYFFVIDAWLPKQSHLGLAIVGGCLRLLLLQDAWPSLPTGLLSRCFGLLRLLMARLKIRHELICLFLCLSILVLIPDRVVLVSIIIGRGKKIRLSEFAVSSRPCRCAATIWSPDQIYRVLQTLTALQCTVRNHYWLVLILLELLANSHELLIGCFLTLSFRLRERGEKPALLLTVLLV